MQTFSAVAAGWIFFSILCCVARLLNISTQTCKLHSFCSLLSSIIPSRYPPPHPLWFTTPPPSPKYTYTPIPHNPKNTIFIRFCRISRTAVLWHASAFLFLPFLQFSILKSWFSREGTRWVGGGLGGVGSWAERYSRAEDTANLQERKIRCHAASQPARLPFSSRDSSNYFWTSGLFFIFFFCTATSYSPEKFQFLFFSWGGIGYTSKRYPGNRLS